MNGSYLYCCGFNHRDTDCAIKKLAPIFEATGADVRQVGTGSGSEELGIRYVGPRKMALCSMGQYLFEIV